VPSKSLINGLGHIQRTILELIAANPDGAWTIRDLCRHVYGPGYATKAQRVAVGRALLHMKLPGTWAVTPPYFSGGLPLWLNDRCNLESARVMNPVVHPSQEAHFRPSKDPRFKSIYDCDRLISPSATQ
jgi:hypothetical protein